MRLKMADLRFSDDLAFPVDIATARVAILGTTGSGKTYGAKRLVEQLLTVGSQVVVFDTVGIWAGLRQPGARGNSFPVPIFGGRNGDVPVDDKSGERVARCVYELWTSAVVDVSSMLDAEMHRFATKFVEVLMSLHAEGPRVTTLVIEECHLVIPQERDVPNVMLNRFAKAVSVGRNYGLGVVMISQRSQAVNKRCLNLAEYLFAYRTTAERDREAIVGWFRSQTVAARDVDVASDIPKLALGEALVFHPSWGQPVKTKALPIESADTSRTLRFGEDTAPTKPVTKPVSGEMLGAIRRMMSAGPPEASAVRTSGKSRDHEREIAVLKEQIVYERGLREGMQFAVSAFKDKVADAVREFEAFSKPGLIVKAPPIADWGESSAPVVVKPHKLKKNAVIDGVPVEAGSKVLVTDVGTGRPNLRKKILTALLQLDGRFHVTLPLLAFTIGHHPRSKSLVNALGALRSGGYVRDYLVLDKGLAEVGKYDHLPRGKQLFDYWCSKLRPAEKRIVVALAARRFETSQELAAYLGLHARTKSFVNTLGRLRGIGVVEGLRLNPDWFGAK